jgi:hypothetical protein
MEDFMSLGRFTGIVAAGSGLVFIVTAFFQILVVKVDASLALCSVLLIGLGLLVTGLCMESGARITCVLLLAETLVSVAVADGWYKEHNGFGPLPVLVFILWFTGMAWFAFKPFPTLNTE